MSYSGRIAGIMVTAGIVITAAACGGGADSTMEADTAVADTGPPHGAGGHDMSAMQVDTALMRRHADQADSMAAETLQDVERLRRMAPGEWYARIDRHVPRVAAMLTMLDRHMREMDMGMGMADDEMGAMMGMSGAEHRAMLELMEALRDDAGKLQTAPAQEVAATMPAHLERLERLLAMLERGAAHMRGASGMQGAGTTHEPGH